MTIDELARMMMDMKSELKEDIAELRVYRETEAARCPYREDIAKGKNNIRRIEALENGGRANVLGAAGGGITILSGIVFGLGRLAGWW